MGVVDSWNGLRANYMAVLVAGAVFSLYWTYFVSDAPLIASQPGFVVFPYLFAALAGLVWLRSTAHRARGPLAVFLVVWSIAWAFEMVLTVARGEAYNFAVFLAPIVVIGLLTKSPTRAQALTALSVLGWMLAGVLVATRLGEILGLLELPYVNPSLISFDTANYWLPFSGYFGVEGRWMGPMGHSAETGFAGALLIVLAALRWQTLRSSVFLVVGILTLLSVGTRSAYTAALGALLVAAVVTDRGPLSRIPYKARIGGASIIVLAALHWKTLRSSVFLVVGILTLLSVGTRSAYTAALGALLVAAVVTDRGPLSRIPYKVRIGGASIIVLLGIVGLFLTRAGLTGRDEIWADYLTLATESPIVGVGTSGIAEAPGWPGVSFHAHNIFIDEFARYGVIGVLLLVLILGSLLWFSYLSARSGDTLGIGIVSAVVIAGLTNSDHSFLGIGYVNLALLLVAVLVMPNSRDVTMTQGQTSPSAST